MTRYAVTALVALVVQLACGCGSELPGRYVFEHDFGAFRYRRYQKTIGPDIDVAGNPGQGHNATYLERGGRHGVSVATAFVSVYTRPASLTAEVREQLNALERYRMSVQTLADENVWLLESGADERWAIWVSGRYVVKLGAPTGEAIPPELADAYLDAYPSDLDEHGRARPDTASRGPSARELAQAKEEEREMPHYLRHDAPR
jgi:hypothetical protein